MTFDQISQWIIESFVILTLVTTLVRILAWELDRLRSVESPHNRPKKGSPGAQRHASTHSRKRRKEKVGAAGGRPATSSPPSDQPVGTDH